MTLNVSTVLAITVRLHDGRYHGMGEWVPSPARLFQALVAAASRGASIDDGARTALEWLESQPPPTVATPRMWAGQRISIFGPDNDLDAVGNDPARVGEIRSPKTIAPALFDVAEAFLYAWALTDGANGRDDAVAICGLAERLYQFGRGVDMAWATGELISTDEVVERLSRHRGPVYRPSPGSGGRTLACPAPGSMASLSARYAMGLVRFREAPDEPGKLRFHQPPKARFSQVPYENPPSRHVFALRKPASGGSFFPFAHARAVDLVVWLRDQAARRLRESLPDHDAEIERVLIGRKPDGSDDGPISQRISIVPLPSIGHEHVDRGIRRILVEVPSECPLHAEDVRWALSGVAYVSPETGEVRFVVTASEQDEMLANYLRSSRTWRTVTPAALPETARRRRIDPVLGNRLKAGEERTAEHARAAAAVTQALRHAGVGARALRVRAQREPFGRRGERVEAFSAGTRFDKHRLWHVEIELERPVSGPIVIGDGRFLGLGVMRPVRVPFGIHVLAVERGLERNADPLEVARAVRRAVMARAQEALGERARLPAYFSGHDVDGTPAREATRPHLTFVFEPRGQRILIIAPHVLDRRRPTEEERNHLAVLDQVVGDLYELRAGGSGRLTLCPGSLDIDADVLTCPAKIWESVTPYVVTRHAKGVTAAEALVADLQAECRRRGLPTPMVTPSEIRGLPGTGLSGHARLEFGVAVQGPVVLGRSRFRGGGVFVGARIGEGSA